MAAAANPTIRNNATRHQMGSLTTAELGYFSPMPNEVPSAFGKVPKDPKKLTFENIIEDYTLDPNSSDDLVYNVFINNYNIYLKEIVANVNNPNSPEFKLEFCYGGELKDKPIIVGKIKDFKDLIQLSEPETVNNYLQTTFLPQLFSRDFTRATLFLKSKNMIKSIKGGIENSLSLEKIIIIISKILQDSFGVEKFVDLDENDAILQEGEDINIVKKGPMEKYLLSKNLNSKLKLKKIINALYIVHQGYMASFLKVFFINSLDSFIQQVPSDDYLIIFDSEKEIVSKIFYLQDTYMPCTFQRGIFIISTNINHVNDDGKIAYIPFNNSIIMEPINDLISIPTINNNNKITNLYFKNYMIYYNLLLKKIINLTNNINIFENLNHNIIKKYIKIKYNETTNINNVYEIENINAWNNTYRIANYFNESSGVIFRNLEFLIIFIYTQLIKIIEDKNIIIGLGLNINIFITKTKFTSLISDSLLPKNVIEIIVDYINKTINFLDIIQINNFNIKIFNYVNDCKNAEDSNTFFCYKESINKFNSKIKIPEIPNNINFNFIFTTNEKTTSLENMEETLYYSEYEKILSMTDAINKFMTVQTDINIPYSSFHTRDMLIASLFSNAIKVEIRRTRFTKLVNDSNLDKVFMYSLLNNIIIKCLKHTKTKDNNNEIINFLKEFLKYRHSNIDMTKYNQKQPYADESKKRNYIIDVLLKDINIISEFAQTDYLDKDYDIFKSYGLNLYLYRMVTEDESASVKTNNSRNENLSVREGKELHAVAKIQNKNIGNGNGNSARKTLRHFINKRSTAEKEFENAIAESHSHIGGFTSKINKIKKSKTNFRIGNKNNKKTSNKLHI